MKIQVQRGDQTIVLTPQQASRFAFKAGDRVEVVEQSAVMGVAPDGDGLKLTFNDGQTVVLPGVVALLRDERASLAVGEMVVMIDADTGKPATFAVVDPGGSAPQDDAARSLRDDQILPEMVRAEQADGGLADPVLDGAARMPAVAPPNAAALEMVDATEWDAPIPDAVLGHLGNPIRAGAPDDAATADDDGTRGGPPGSGGLAPAIRNTTPGANARFADGLPDGETPAPAPAPVDTKGGTPLDVPSSPSGNGGDPAPVTPIGPAPSGPADGDPPAGETPVDVPTTPTTPVEPPRTSGGGGSGGGGSGGGGSAPPPPPPDTTAPKVTGVTSPMADIEFTEPDGTITFTVTFNEVVTVAGGVPGLQLETGADDGEAKYVSGSGSNTLTFEYTVRSGDQAPDLDYLSTGALVLNGATIKDAAGNDADLTLAAPGAAGSIAIGKDLVLNVPFVQIPTITGLTAATDTGVSPTDGFTTVDVPEIRGTAGADHTVKIYDGATEIAEVTADASGNWSYTPAAPLTEGAHNLQARGIDLAGARSSKSAVFTVTVDQTAPADPVVTGLSATSDTGTAGDNLGNSAMPEIVGSAEPNARIEVFDGATSLGTTTADATGAWTFTPAAPLAEGDHVITAQATDRAGNPSGTSPAVTISLDLTPPTTPAITGLTAATDTGVSPTDGNTSQVRPTLQGTAQPGVTIELLDGATSLGTTLAAADGSWSFTPAADLAEGAHALTAVAKDEAGNASPATAAFTVTVDTTAPTGVGAAALSAASDLGASSVDGVTNVATPTITGTTDPGATVQIFDGATLLGAATADGAGAWTFTPAAPLTAGTHSITSRATDLAGNLGPASPAFAVTIDLTAPAAPVVTGLAPGSDTGANTSDGLTNMASPTLRGTAEANAAVEVFDGATSLGTTTADGTGAWTFTPAAPLAAGAHSITAKATDLAGNQGPASGAVAIAIDATAPAAPTLAGLTAATDTGTSTTDGVTKVVTPTFTATAEAGATVTLVDVTGTTPVTLGTAVAAGDGSWSITPAAALGQGAHQIVARATDAAGNTGADGTAFTATIDTTAPTAPAKPGLTAATDAGASSTDSITNVATPTIAGTTDPGATVEVFDGATSLGTTTADGAGAWTFTPAAPLAAGTHAITARATDLAGNQGPASLADSLRIDLTAPAAPVVTGLAPGSDTGPSATDGATNVATPGIVGTAEAGATVEVRVDGVAIGTATADAGGAWTFTPAAAIADGAHAVTAIATDVAGNQGAASAAFNVSIDATAPAAPAITGFTAATDTGASATDGITKTTTPVLTGTAEANATVQVFDGATSLGTTTADGAGAWSFTPAAPLAAGAHSFTARATDAAGNQGAASPAFAATIDLTAPAAPTVTGLAPASDTGTSNTDGLTVIERPEIVGTGEANATIEVFSGATSLGTTTADGTGAWSFTPAAPLAGGLHTITARAIDLAGNQGPASPGVAIVIDATPPDAPVITGLTAATDSGASATDGVTNVAAPAVTGTTRPFATVEVFDGATSLGTVTAGLSGAWTLNLAAPLTEGVHGLTAKATSASGLASPLSAVRTVTVDLTAPATPTLAGLAPGSDTGVSGVDGLTGNARPTFVGTAAPGAIVQVLDGATVLGATTADAAGTWAFTPTAPLAAGGHAVTARTADVAGNLSPATAPVAISIDATAPAAPVIGGLTAATDAGSSSADGVTNVATPTITGTAEANATVEVFDGTTTLGTATADGAGAWSLTPAAPLADGTHVLTAVARDAAGNQGPGSAPKAVTIDGAPPAAPTIFGLTPATDSGASALDGLTSNAAPTLVGRAEPGAKVEVLDGATSLGTATADAQGHWSFTPAAPLPAGAHAFTAVATDLAGNAGPASTPLAVTIDLSAPATPAITGLDPATDTGPDNTDSLTFNDRPTLVGTAEPNVRLEVFDGATSLGFATADAGGAWAFTPLAPLSQGTHAFTARALDAAGNASAASAAKAVTVNAAPPGTPTLTGFTAATDTGVSSTDGVTSNATPTLQGTAAPNAVVEVYDGPALLGTATADAGGNWSFTPAALAEGSHVIGVRATDAAGNKGAFQAARTIVVDSTAPATPTIAGLTPATDTGASAGDGVTSAPRPTLTGSAEAGGRVEIFDGATSLGTATVDAAGLWSFTPAADLAGGAHTFTAVALDAAGNASAASAATVVTRDDAAPGAPAITGLTAATDTGVSTVDRLTRDARPVVTGTAEPGAEVRVFDGAVQVGTTTADGTGAWSLALGAPLAAGAHALTARAVDASGQLGAASPAVSVTIDVAAPPAPTIAGLTAATDTGASSTDGRTGNASPTLRGTAEAGARVELFDGGASLGTATADGSGNWTFTPAAPLADGPHVFTAIATDPAGNAGPASAPALVTIDATAPAAPTITGLTAATDTGASNTDGVTSSASPVLQGTAEPGATVVIKDGGAAIATTTADGTGRWTVGLTLSAGSHSLTAEATDAAGNAGAASAAKVIQLDSTAPAAPTGLGLGAGTDLGASATDGVTANVRPLIVGQAEALATVAVFDGATLLGTTTADASGNWAFTPTADLAAGSHTLTARATDSVGNLGPASAAMAVTIDVTAPGTPTVTGLTAATDTGASSTDGLTNVATPTFRGTATAGATLTIYDGATPLGTATADGSGNWTFAPAAPLASGSHTITATATDLAGNQSGTSAPITVVIDANAPAVPLVAGLTAATDSGVSNTDGVTGNATPTIVGTAEPGASVKVFDGTTLLGTVTADATGSWSLVPPALGEGSHNVTATATDAVGNVSAASAVRVIAVDTTITAVPTVTGLAPATDTGASNTDGATGNRTPTIVGTAEPNSAVTVFDGGVPLGTTTADGTGAWSFTPSAALAAGAHTITASFTDLVGNASAVSAAKAISIDATSPGAPTLTGLTAASDTGASTSDGVTGNNKPTLVGTAEAGATVKVFDGTTAIGSATADAGGNWSFTPATALADGPHTLSVAVEDAAGNLSQATSPVLVTIDTSLPTATVVTGLTAATDTGRSATDAITNLTTPTIIGTAEAFATVTISNGATVLGTTTADARGDWAFTPGTAFVPNSHSITAKATDQAGNAGAASAAKIVTVDNVAPTSWTVSGLTTATDTGSVSTDGITGNATPTITGTAEAGATVRVFDGASLLGTTIADAAGNWSFAVPTALASGNHAITAVDVDIAGNVGPASPAKVITIDAAAPATPVVLGLTTATDTGTSNSDGKTTNAAPTFRGTAEANSLVTVYDGATALGTTAADGTGNWTFTPASNLAQGNHAITAVATDLAGNASNPSAVYATVIDGAAPGAPVITGLTAATDTGLYDSDRTTTNLKPTIVGTAEAGAALKIFDGAAQIGTATADQAGNWSFTPASNLAQGAHVITVTATDATGSAGVASAAVTVTIDTAAPAAPVVAGLTAATDTGSSSTDALTANAKPAITGTAEANAQVEVFDGAASLGKTSADASGNWTLTPTTAFTASAHTLTAKATDAAGNVSAASAAKVVTVDLTAPGTPVVTGLTVATDLGSSTTDGITSNASPTIAGTADANATVSVFDGTTLLGTATANGSGAWSFTPSTAFTAGSHTILASTTDAAGNTSALSAPVAIFIDATAPAAPVISGLAAGQDTGPNGEDGGTSSTTPTIAGTAEAGTTVKISEGAVLKGTVTADGAGNWTFTFPTALTAGAHALTATATDVAGNVSAVSASKTITVDGTAPGVPVITGVVATSDSGPVSTDGVTNDTTPTIAGTAEANAQVKVFDGGTLIGTVAADGTGNWSFTPATALTQADHVITAQALDAAGNLTAVSASKTIKVDTTAPVAPTMSGSGLTAGTDTGASSTDGITSDTTPDITGAAEANATVSVYAGGTLLGTTTADGAGAWTFTPASALASGTHVITATASDLAGNVGPASTSKSITIDPTAPAVPVITGLASGSDSGRLATDFNTSDTTPTFQGTAEAGVKVEIYNGAALLGAVTADANGDWTYTPAALADGSYAITAKAVDTAGGTSAATAVKTLVIDTAAPTAVSTVVGGLTAATDSGTSTTDDLTNDSTPTIDGTAEANAIVEVYEGATKLGQTLANGSGAWSFAVPTAFTHGTHTITAKAIDTAGNTGATSAGKAIQIDVQVPPTPSITGLTAATDTGASSTDGDTSDTTPALTGTAEAGAIIEVFDGTTSKGTTTADGSGNWTFDFTAALTAGNHTMTVTAKDAAGNVSAASSPFTVGIDSAVAAPVITGLDPAADTGTSSTDEVTKDTRPAILGTAEGNTTITVKDGTTVLGTTSTDAAGAWFFRPATALSAGTHTITATSTDGSGNTSVASASMALVIDTGAPPAPVIGGLTTASDTGSSTTDDITGDTTPSIEGTAENNAIVQLYEGANVLGTVTASATGTWTYTPTSAMPAGAHTITAKAQDLAGNIGVASGSYTFTIGSTPTTPTVSGILGSSDTGADGADGVTSDTTPTLYGTARPGATITIKDGSTTLGTTVVPGGGTWTYTTPVLAAGAHSINASDTDVAGNVVTSANKSITIDATAPTVSGVASTNSGTVNPGTKVNIQVTFSEAVFVDTSGGVPSLTLESGTTNRQATYVSGSGTTSLTFEYFVHGGDSSADLDYTATTALALNGATIKDDAGNAATLTLATPGAAGSLGANEAIVIGTTIPANPVIFGIGVNTGAPYDHDDKTSDTTPTLSGQATAGATVTIFEGATSKGTTTANATTGLWTFTFGTAQTVGSHTYTAKVGAASSTALTVTIDNTVPAAPVITGITTGTDTGTDGDRITSITTPTITGTTEAGTFVTIKDGATTLGTVAASGTTWSFTPTTALTAGAHGITATAKDAMGNVSLASASLALTITTSTPATPVFTGLTAATDTGSSSTDRITKDTTPTFYGTASPGTTVQVFDGITKLAGNQTMDASGNWTFTPTAALANGIHAITVRVADTAGNASAATAAKTVTIDGGALTATIQGLTPATDSGDSTIDNVTSNTKPTLTGTASANSTIEVLEGATVLGTTTADAAGDWSYTFATALTAGAHSITARASDTAGNTLTTAAKTLTIDTGAPTVVSVSSTAAAGTYTIGDTIAIQVVFSEAVDVVKTGGVPSLTLETGATDRKAEYTSGSGTTTLTFTYTVQPGDTSADLNYVATSSLALNGGTIKDPAGNAATLTLPATTAATSLGGSEALVIDTTAPAVPVITGLTTATDTGSSSADRVTSDTTPTLSGTADPGVKIDVYDGATKISPQVTANATTGAWTFTPTTALTAGVHTLTARASDAAGNQSQAAIAKTVTIDATAPATPVFTGLTAATDTGSSDTDRTTSNLKPTLTGTAEAGASVEIFDGATSIATVTADGNGGWSFTPAANLTVTTHSITVKATDLAGNASAASVAKVVTIDNVAPVQPVVTGITAATDTGTSNSDAITNNTRPVLQGTAEGSATIQVLDGTTVLGTTTAAAGGAWTFTPAAALTNGTHSITVKATDLAGNTSVASAAKTVTIDAAMAAPVITGLTTATDTGTSTIDGITKNATPTISGTAEANATITIKDGATTLGTATANGSGAWSFTPGTALSGGTHTITATAGDTAGNTSPASNTLIVQVDTTAPAAPVVQGLTAATDLGSSTTDAITKATTPTIVGSAEPLATVVVKDGATTIGTVTADASGNWSVTPGTAFTAATHAITATATDVAGNAGVASAAKNVLVDVTAPTTPAAPALAAGSDTGASATDGLTNDATPTLTGTTEAGATIKVFDGATLLGSAVADGTGAWSFTTPALATGAHTLTVTATDVAGNTSAASAAKTVTVDTTAPNTPVLTGLQAGSDTGASSTDGITSDTTPTLVGTADAGVTVQIRDGATVLGTTTADGTGNWTYTPAAQAAGPHAFSAVAIDTAGNLSPGTPALPVFIDTAAPSAPVVLGLKPTTDTGFDFADAITANLTPTIIGTAEAGSTVQVLDGVTSLGTTTADASGRWSFTPGAALTEGSHAITAKATDASGATSQASAAKTVLLDATAPAVPAITGLTAATDSGTSSTDGLTRHASPTLQGTAEANVPVQIFDGATLLGTTTANGSGAWTFTPPSPLASGAHSLTAKAVDLAGNASAASPALAVTIDAGAPAAPVFAGLTAATDTGTNTADGITSNATPTFQGTAEANAIVTVYDGAAVVGTTTADGAGAWSFTPGTALAAGSHAISVRATDAAGNQGGASATRTIVIDAGAPGAPTILGLTAATDTGASSTDGITSNATPTLVGTAEAGAVVEIFDGAASLGTVTADATGAWSFVPGSALATGAHSFTATARDASGRTGAASTAFAVEIDPTVAAAPVITGLATGMDTGASATDGVTRLARPTFVGTAEPGAVITVSEGAVVLGTTKADGAGAWSFAAPAAFAAGAHTVTAKATDAAGQTSPASAGYAFNLDLSAPATPTLAGITAATDTGTSNADGLTSVLRPVFTGTAEANALVRVYDGATEAGMTTADAAGNWSFTPAADLAAGAHTFTAVAEDLAGNRSASAVARTVVVDATPPNAPVVTGLTAASDSGTSNLDGVTGVVMPTIVGLAEPNAKVEVFDGATSLGVVTADGTGSWSITPAAPLAEGAHAITAKATDAAGGVSAASVVRPITIDTGTGAAPVVTGLAAASDLGTSNADALTSSTRPTIVGQADPMSAVQVFDGGTLLGSTTADAAGAWAFTPPTALAAGTHNITAVFTDLVGNTSAASAATPITIDTAAPGAPTLAGLAAGSDSGASNSDGITSVLRPVITGAGAEAGGTVRVFDGATLLGAATADGAGNWSFTPAADLSAGSHTLTAAGVDAAGNVSPASAARTIGIDPIAPAAPVVAGLTAATDSGLSLTDGITCNARPTITGFAEPGAAVQLFDGATSLGTVTASATGTWSFTPAADLAAGPHVVTAIATDPAGNVSATSAATTVTIDGAAPAAPSIAGLTAATDTGASSTDGVTRLATPTVAGTAEPNAKVEVFEGVASLGQTIADGAGNWTLTLTFGAGAHTLTAVATDVAGRTSGPSAAATITVDTTAPGGATLAGLTAATDTGASTTDRVTANASPSFTGTAPANATVELVEAGVVIATATADASGTWAVAPAAPLAAGTHMIAARAIDAAGNASALGAASAVVIDPTAPTAPVVLGLTPATDTGASRTDGVTANATPTLVGTAEPGATVEAFDGATSLGTATADGTGAWSLTPVAPLAAGAHAITAKATDAAGNAGAASAAAAVTITAGAATAPAIDGLLAASDTGASAVDGVTRDQRPTLTGTAGPGATVEVLLDGTRIGTVAADGAGAWSFTPAAAIAPGTRVVTAREVDAGGVAGPASSDFTLVVDVAGPAAPVVTGLTPASDTGPSSTDGVTGAVTPTIAGTAGAGETIEVFDGATSLGTTTADGAGAWSFTPAAPLAAGSHAIGAVATDLAGNVSAAATARTIVVDGTAPAAPVVTGLTAASDTGPSSTDGVTGDDRPTITGTAGAGEAIEVFAGGTSLGTTTAGADGAWAFTPAAPLAAGTLNVTAVASSAAGVPSAASAPRAITIVAGPAGAPAITGLAAGSDTGPSAVDGVTNHATPTIAGVADPNAVVRVFDNSPPTPTSLGTTVADGAGAWTFTPAAALAGGDHELTAAVEGETGLGPASAAFTVAIDMAPPSAPAIAGLTPATDTGASSTDAVTAQASPTITGTAEPGATITVHDGGTMLGTAIADGAGDWSWSPAAPLAEGPHSLVASATDVAGNASAATAFLAVTVDATAPDAPVVAGLTPGTDDGASDADGLTAALRPTIVGTAEAGASVEVFDGGTSLGTTTADAAGRWSLDVGADLALGNHAITARATDAAGNEGADSATATVSVVPPGSSYRLGDDGGDGLWLGDFASGGTFTADLGDEPITMSVQDVLSTPGAHDVLLAAVDAAATARDATQADLPIGAIPEAAPMLLPDQHLLVL